MRFGLMADVHANLPALERVIERLSEESVDAYLCAGDLVGYGPHPNECIERISALGAVCVAGNHDLIAASRLGTEGIGALARQTLAWTESELRSPNLRALQELPLTVEVGQVLMAHGSIDDPRRYVTPRRAPGELDRLARSERNPAVLVLGHTHRPLAHGSASGELLSDRSGTVRFQAAEALLVNPGSVGQSRERRPVARFAVLDLDRRQLELRDTSYDHVACRRALRQRGLPPRGYHRNPNGVRARLGRLQRSARPSRIATARGSIRAAAPDPG